MQYVKKWPNIKKRFISPFPKIPFTDKNPIGVKDEESIKLTELEEIRYGVIDVREDVAVKFGITHQ